jgi:hypothetical protein
MTRTLEVVFDGEVLRPAAPLDLPPNRRYLITIQEVARGDVGDAWDVLEALTGTVDAPADWSKQHDHYLYGTPKRSESE